MNLCRVYTYCLRRFYAVNVTDGTQRERAHLQLYHVMRQNNKRLIVSFFTGKMISGYTFLFYSILFYS